MWLVNIFLFSGAKSCAELKQKSGFLNSGEYFIGGSLILNYYIIYTFLNFQDPALSGIPIRGKNTFVIMNNIYTNNAFNL